MIEDAEAVEAACLEFEAKPWAPKATTATPPPPPKPAPKQRKVVCDSDDGGPSSGDEWNPEKGEQLMEPRNPDELHHVSAQDMEEGMGEAKKKK